MVWGLLPVDSPRGTQKYYIFSAGTYKVGRKDCDVIVQTDTSISRVHAEIIVDKMVSWEPANMGPASQSHVHILDRSKYGTFLRRGADSEATRLKKDEDVVLRDEDLVTFGTGNATFRFTFIPLVLYLCGKKPSRMDPSFQSTMSSIGAFITRKWIDECTHVLVEECSPLTNEIIDAVLARKEIVATDWFKVLAPKNICTEIRSCTPYIPGLMLDNVEIKMVEAKLRENCLEGHIFILGSSDKYKFGEKLESLLNMAGAKFLHVHEFCLDSQKSSDIGEQDETILVIPSKSPLEFNHSKELSSLSKVTDLKLISAILSGKLEPAVVEPPSFIVTSSHSTEETIVAESDVEIDTATSAQPKEDTSNATEDPGNFNLKEQKADVVAPIVVLDTTIHEEPKLREEGEREMERINKGDKSVVDRDEHSDIIFIHDLIVRSYQMSPPAASDPAVVDFKRFRKREIVSGNSYHNLIPFEEDPYKELDEQHRKHSEFIQEERKRKQMEAMAEDLFNTEKGRKKAYGSTSIHAILSSR
ncbi:Nijmegen breakage syndrome 1 protein [Rhynchospora pubera]|uniref:Nijmegen breakage syndrome 1 protein n=1 Tax=Rhynchospora pubera TaxID=906938 RepID=A0AAV8EZK9_9POAL|nr:Nijmegen breakage syndrome 1 protein [Rhynchospora pubera]